MLDLGFIDDVDRIISYADENRRLLLFSATMPGRISQLAEKYMRDVKHLKVGVGDRYCRSYGPDIFRGAGKRQVRRTYPYH